MASEKMPISLLKNEKTTNYLKAVFDILQDDGKQLFLLKEKVLAWLDRKESKRLDLNAQESELLEQCSHHAYDLLSKKKELREIEKRFIAQHEFFFKN